MSHTRTSTLAALGSAMAVGAVLAVASGPAFAAGGGYSPGSGSPVGSNAGFTTVVSSLIVTSSGGNLGGSADGSTASVVIPAGALPVGSQIVLTSGASSGIAVGSSAGTVVAAFGVTVLTPQGQVMTGSFAGSITLTITNPAIASTDRVVEVTGPGTTIAAPNAQVTNGSATVTFSSDPDFAVVSSSTAATPTPTGSVPGATSVTTGEPFVGEGILAGLLVVGGASVAVMATRRRRHARPSA